MVEPALFPNPFPSLSSLRGPPRREGSASARAGALARRPAAAPTAWTGGPVLRSGTAEGGLGNPGPGGSRHCRQQKKTPAVTGARAVPGSQQLGRHLGRERAWFATARSWPLRARDGSRSGGSVEIRPPGATAQSRNGQSLLLARGSRRSGRFVVAGAARVAGVLLGKGSGSGPAAVRGGSRNSLCLQGVSAAFRVRRSFGWWCEVVTPDRIMLAVERAGLARRGRLRSLDPAALPGSRIPATGPCPCAS